MLFFVNEWKAIHINCFVKDNLNSIERSRLKLFLSSWSGLDQNWNDTFYRTIFLTWILFNYHWLLQERHLGLCWMVSSLPNIFLKDYSSKFTIKIVKNNSEYILSSMEKVSGRTTFKSKSWRFLKHIIKII